VSASGQPAAVLLAGPRAAAGVARVLWRFSRPHTIVGTTVSVMALYVIAADAGHATGAADLAATLLAAWCVNVAIVGLNQIEDVEIDRINKPELPLAAGTMSPGAAKAIVTLATAAPVAMALSQGPIELVAVLTALAAGAAYSSGPLRLKRYPVLAALSITIVRSVVVNLGVYGHFAGSLEHMPDVVWALTLFVLPFSAAIALLKDVPDIEGDRRFRIRTFSVRLGPRRVLAVALGLLAAAYLGMAVAGAVGLSGINNQLLTGGHLGALGLLAVWAGRAAPDDGPAFTRFYMRVWQLFFLEYGLVALSAVT
jgi:homogentisate phytyltransferase / homogentisate geranylgeranyltransferase